MVLNDTHTASPPTPFPKAGMGVFKPLSRVGERFGEGSFSFLEMSNDATVESDACNSSINYILAKETDKK